MTHTPTPRPWDYVPSTEHHGPYITSEFGSTICDCYVMSHPSEPSTAADGKSKPIHFLHEMADPNAALIVRAVNAHDALVKALKELDGAIEAEDNGNVGSLARARVKVHAALKLAKGEP